MHININMNAILSIYRGVGHDNFSTEPHNCYVDFTGWLIKEKVARIRIPSSMFKKDAPECLTK